MVSVNGQQSGPFNMQQLSQFVTTGEFNQETHVWKQGMENWKKAGEVAELNSLFNSNPQGPPPPPSAGPPPPPVSPPSKPDENNTPTT